MNTPTPLTRRQWLGQMSGPVLVASVGASLLPTTGRAAENTEDRLAGARVYNIRDFGAKGDGTTLDTAALQAAIDACHAAHGGTVLVPAGVFVIGTTELKSNVTLHLAAQGKLLGSADGNQYHATDSIPLFAAATSELFETWQYAARTLSAMSPAVSRAVWRFGKLWNGCALNCHVCESASERTTKQSCFPCSDHRRAEADFSNRSKWYFDSL